MEAEYTDCEMILSEVHAKYAALKDMFNSLGQCMPDMVWVKDTEGRYTYANNTVAYNLYRTTVSDMMGKGNDELAEVCRKKHGGDNFTFGHVCSDSDKSVLRTQVPTKFLERGLVDGKELILMVHKSVERDIRGNVIGVVGIGRDVTAEYQALERIASNTTDDATAAQLRELIYLNYYTKTDEGK